MVNREAFCPSQEELFTIHTISRFVNELILSLFLVKCTKLQCVKLQSELRTYFFDCTCLTILCKLVTMVAEEDEVSLVVQGDYATCLQVGNLGE